MAVAAYVFDLGETLVDERRHWAHVADLVGVSHERMWSALEDAAARQVHHHALFDDLGVERPDVPMHWQMSDLYPDAVHCLGRLRDAGYLVGCAANQPPEAEDFLRRLFPWDLVGVSALWGVDKPDPAFFRRIAASLPCAPGEIAYVGDRVDNDVLPALDAGMVAVHLARGPWGRSHETPPGAIRIETLHDLPEAVDG